MTKLERVRTALRGEAPDRPPYGFWTHLPGIDLDPRRLGAATAAFATRYDLDFVKSMPNGLYCVEDWGVVADYGDIERGGVASVVTPAVQDIGDWRRLERVDVNRGAFGRELTHLESLIGAMGDVPVLATVFSPLTIAGKLSGGIAHEHIAADPSAIREGLEAITSVTAAFARAAIERGCAGIFFAVQDASYVVTEDDVYLEFGAPYDRRVISEAKRAGGWFNVVHMHGERVMFELLSRYDVDALNWHIGETIPTLGDYRAAGGTRPVVGGIQRGHVTRRDEKNLRGDIERAMEETGGAGILLAPGCVIRHPVDEATLALAAALIKSYASTRRSQAPM